MLGLPVYEKLAMVLAVFLVITIMAIAVLRLKWYFLLMLPVVSIIGMEMFHGKAPSVSASFFLVTGISGLLFSMKLEMHGGRRNFWQDSHIPGQMPERYGLFLGNYYQENHPPHYYHASLNFPQIKLFPFPFYAVSPASFQNR